MVCDLEGFNGVVSLIDWGDADWFIFSNFRDVEIG